MSMFSYTDPRSRPIRELRRLSLATVVKTNYVSRTAEIEVVNDDNEDAIHEGYEDGYAEGLAKAAVEAATKREEDARRTEHVIGALDRALTALEDDHNRLRSEISATVPALAFELLEQLLARELKLTDDPGRDAISRALSLDDGGQPATIRMNPADVDTLRDISDIVLDRKVTIVPDPGIESGGAVVDIGRATFDARLGQALERVKRVLLGKEFGKVGE